MVALGLVLALSATAACGDEGGGGTDGGEVNTDRVAVDAWAAEVCTAAEEEIPEFVSSIEDIDLQAVRDEDIAEGTRFLKALLPATLDFTGAFLEAMAAAGIPDTAEAPSAEDWRALMSKSRESLEASRPRSTASWQSWTRKRPRSPIWKPQTKRLSRSQLASRRSWRHSKRSTASLISMRLNRAKAVSLATSSKEGEECEGVQQRLEDEFAELESGDNG